MPGLWLGIADNDGLRDSQLPTTGDGVYEKTGKSENKESAEKPSSLPDFEHVKSAVR